jgi:hypothetical protein
MTTSTPVDDADQLALARLVIDAAWRLDQGLAESFGDLFTEDATLDVGARVMRGRGAIAAWAATLAQSFQRIRHAVSNMRFTRTGDAQADGVTLVTIFLDDETHTSIPWSVGEEHDRYVRTADGWRLASRRFSQLFSRRPEGEPR